MHTQSCMLAFLLLSPPPSLYLSETHKFVFFTVTKCKTWTIFFFFLIMSTNNIQTLLCNNVVLLV